MNYSLLRSKTFWTLVVMSLLPIANALVPIFPAGVQDAITLVLGALASYFHRNGMVQADAVN